MNWASRSETANGYPICSATFTNVTFLSVLVLLCWPGRFSLVDDHGHGHPLVFLGLRGQSMFLTTSVSCQGIKDLLINHGISALVMI